MAKTWGKNETGIPGISGENFTFICQKSIIPGPCIGISSAYLKCFTISRFAPLVALLQGRYASGSNLTDFLASQVLPDIREEQPRMRMHNPG
jgi:hypothetical protein